MAISDASSKSFMNELMRISVGIVWKNQFEARQGDGGGSVASTEAYIAARKGELNFYTLPNFEPHILRAFIPNEEQYLDALRDKRSIPKEVRDSIVQAEQEWIIDQWENHDGEQNDYYRKLFGLPAVATPENHYLYNERYGDIDMDTPIHLLEYTDRLKLEKRGYIDELLAHHPEPEYEYLRFVGKHRIFPYVARQAEAFDILWIPESQFDNLRRDFVDVYEQVRRMFIRVYYTDAYRIKDMLYEGFIGMCILFATQQRMCSKYIETNITRDFYDMESLRLVYAAYGMPFYANIPIKYHERVVKRMNELIAYKGSTQVFYDMFNIFNFGQMDVFEYFLVKKRLVDKNGNPIFRDMYGNPLSEEDMWQLRFARISWKDDKYVEVTKPENFVPYTDLTVPDPYWVEDEDLQKKLYERDWNYFHSKYLGVEIMFELSKLVFEICYFMRMLQDNRETTQNITTYYMVTGTEVPLYDMVVYALALLCKNAGFTGEIPSDPAQIAGIYGFNFTEYNRLLKMTAMSMNDFVLNFKEECHNYMNENPILAVDEALNYWVDQVTDGAFSYLGEDFPYGEEHMAPPPMFVHDFVPTRNSVHNLKAYLRNTIDFLKSDEGLSDVEIGLLYKQFYVKEYNEEKQNYLRIVGALGEEADPEFPPDPEVDPTEGYEKFEVKSTDFSKTYEDHWIDYIVRKIGVTDEVIANLRAVLLASYEQMYAWVIRLLETRRALTFDPHILKLIQDMNIYNKQDVDEVYSKLKDLDSYLTVKMQECKSRLEYDAYYNVRKILMTTSLVRETFTKKNDHVASSYEDLLADINPTLYRRLIDDEIDAGAEEEYVIQALMNLSNRLELLQAVNGNNLNRVMGYLMKILKFLKSAKVDIVGFEAIFLISDRSMNYLKLISEIYASFVEQQTRDWFYLYDGLHVTHVLQTLESRFALDDPNLAQRVLAVIKDNIPWYDNAEQITQLEGRSAFQYLFAWIHSVFENQTIVEKLPMEIRTAISTEFDGRSKFALTDSYERWNEFLKQSIIDWYEWWETVIELTKKDQFRLHGQLTWFDFSTKVDNLLYGLDHMHQVDLESLKKILVQMVDRIEIEEERHGKSDFSLQDVPFWKAVQVYFDNLLMESQKDPETFIEDARVLLLVLQCWCSQEIHTYRLDRIGFIDYIIDFLQVEYEPAVDGFLMHDTLIKAEEIPVPEG